MTFVPGTWLGPYEIVALLGAGGMGKVYRARDTQLKREVALKVLPPEVAADADRLARFQREAELLAALNHPNIAQIHGLVEAGPTSGSGASASARLGSRALVMELIEGETLAERIGRGPVPVEDALPLAGQLAEALEYAHERGIIHRDLKPANIKITPDGRLKVLDFGLAKALETRAPTGDPAAGPTLTSPAMTQAGIILGTAAYMSPEQARGAALDKRTDIWAFGVVLFEMLTGRPCFPGDSVTDVLAAVVKSDPDWAALPADTPRRVRDLLNRCLAKDRKQRLHDIADARLEIEAALTSPAGIEAGPAPGITTAAAAAAGFWTRRRAIALAGLMLVLGAVVAGLVLNRTLTRPAAPGAVIHAAITLPEGHALFSSPAISPDGRTVAFVSGGPAERPRLYTRRLLDDFDLRAIPGTEGADSPFFSPDGRSVAFFANGRLYRVSLDGGLPSPLARAVGPAGGTWGDDDSIVFARAWNEGLFRVPAGGGEPELLIRPDGVSSYAFVFPRFLPGAGALLFTTWDNNPCAERLMVASRERSKVLSPCSTNVMPSVSGHILYGTLRSLFKSELLAAPGPGKTAGSSRAPVSVRSDVFGESRMGKFWFDLSRNGTLAYAAGHMSRNILVRVNQSGRVSTGYGDHGNCETPALSWDGTRVAYTRDGKIYVRNLQRGDEPLLSTEAGAAILWNDRSPAWNPDGSKIVYQSNRNGNWDLYVKDASGAGKAEPLVEKKHDQMLSCMRKDGTTLFVESHPETARDIWIRRPDGRLEKWLATPYQETWPAFSPDGRLVAYGSDESGRFEIYISPFSDSEKRLPISTDGGAVPVWSAQGDRLFFRQGTKIMAVDVRPDGDSAGKPQELFDGGWSLGTTGGIPVVPNSPNVNGFAVMSNGDFLMVRAEPEAIPTKIHVIFNWFEELNRLCPIKK